MRRFQAQRGRAVVLLFALAFAVPAFASTIVANTGDDDATESGDASDWIAEGWSQAGSYTDVTVKATLSQLVIGTQHGKGFAFMEEQVGNHAVQLDSTTFTFPDNNSQVTLFSNLSLGPGTYYLALYGEGFGSLSLRNPIPRSPVRRMFRM